jgi:asparagine synthase (glutamine-hydrolysing)
VVDVAFPRKAIERDDWFLAVETATDSEADAAAHLRRLSGAHPAAVQHSFALSGGRCLTVLCADATRIVESPRHWLWIHGPRPPTKGLRQRLRSAPSTADLRQTCTSVDGEDCSFVIVDKDTGECCAITDRLNFSPILHGRIDGHRYFGSSLTLFPRDGMTLDVAGIASYIVNGNCLNNRTLFREVSHLERASVNRFRDGLHEQEIYWHYAPGRVPVHAPWEPADAAAQLWELLVESVDRMTRGKKVLLSLTGGYDSGVLLGILGARLKHPDVTCVTYTHGPRQERSDAAVAAKQAAIYRYKHIPLVSYAGDLLPMLDVNAVLGQGRRRPAYEIDALSHLAERHADRTDVVMLFGDECLGMSSYRVDSADDILGAAVLKSPALLDRFHGVLGAALIARLRTAIESDYDVLRQKARNFAHPDDAKDFLYLDQRLSFGLLPLRNLFAGHWFPVATPLMSPAVVDFMAAVPVAYRIDKRLFKQMARRFLPEQFRIPRSVDGKFHPVFRQEIAAAHDVLAAAAAARGWKIDGVLSTAALIDLLRTISKEAATSARADGRTPDLRRRLFRRVKRLVAGSRLLEERQHWWRRRLFNNFAEVPDPGYLLVNILSLANFLADTPAQSDRL